MGGHGHSPEGEEEAELVYDEVSSHAVKSTPFRREGNGVEVQGALIAQAARPTLHHTAG